MASIILKPVVSGSFALAYLIGKSPLLAWSISISIKPEAKVPPTVPALATHEGASP
jgi:hypothetical protein